MTTIRGVSPATLIAVRTARRPTGAANSDLSSALVRVARIAQTYVQKEALMPHRLDWNEYQVLSIVAASPNIRSVRAADRAGMTRAKLSGVVARLHERGLLRRIELDGSRRVDLALTSMGADLCNRTAASVADAERRFMQLPTARRTLGALSRHIGVALASR